MAEQEVRALHFHTLESLVADLVSGRPVGITDGGTFSFSDPRVRSALDWYRRKGSANWAANVSAQHGEELVDSILKDPPVLPLLAARASKSTGRRLFLKKVEAHRFAGLHKFGTKEKAPDNFVYEFGSPITIFEGRNGSGKTSLLNAIIWTLTGELLRPQREPETVQDFDCRVVPLESGAPSTIHRLSPLTPMPDVDRYRPEQGWVHADTWVELTFTDESGALLPVIKRSENRTNQGKLKDNPPDLSVLGVDPIAFRLGTVMPGLLPHIQVGSESELGKAVSQLTGLSSLADLAEHARRAKLKIEREFTKAKIAERDKSDSNYTTAKGDLERITKDHPSIAYPHAIPDVSENESLELSLTDLALHFDTSRRAAFGSAKEILGDTFDPSKSESLLDLEKNVSRALERVSQPQTLASAARLAALKHIQVDALDQAASKIQVILAQAAEIDELARNPAEAARARLYARVVNWRAEHPGAARPDSECDVCGGSLSEAIDPVTLKPVADHLQNAASGAQVLEQTLHKWAIGTLALLSQELPEALRAELVRELPAHPIDLLRSALEDEMFAFEPFRGVLSALKSQLKARFGEVTESRAPLVDGVAISLPQGLEKLTEALTRLNKAIRFARWRHANEGIVRDVVTKVLGREADGRQLSGSPTLAANLVALQEIVRSAQPIRDALLQCDRLKKELTSRRAIEKRLREYTIAASALSALIGLGDLADRQVAGLRVALRDEAAKWRSRIYLGAFPDTAHELVEAGLGRKGELDLLVQKGGVVAPAQHVVNASALRASLVAFFFAFWEHVLGERGGLATLLLDDPQELLDDENRERFSASLTELVRSKSQIILTSYDPRFCAEVSRLKFEKKSDHFELLPATVLQPVVRVVPPTGLLEQRKQQYDLDRNEEGPARDFVDSCRVFLESKLGDMFDDPAHVAWASSNPHPTLADFVQRLRQEVKAGSQGMFSALVFRNFVNHPAVADGSNVLILMNKAHHGRRQEIRASEVALCADDLMQLVEFADLMHTECYRWRRRDKLPEMESIATFSALESVPPMDLSIVICPDLAAFTSSVPSGESQAPVELLDNRMFSSIASFYLRRSNFGFAAPEGSIAMVDSASGAALDRSLAIVRYGTATYARRIVRDRESGLVGLTADSPDPRARAPKTIFLPAERISVHRVLGILVEHSVQVAQGKDEAVAVDIGDVLKEVELAFQIVDDSAVPFALEGQIVLGGKCIALDELRNHVGTLVALTLDDGSGIFKRVGAQLPGDLSDLIQLESVGGLGSSQILSVGSSRKGIRSIATARRVVGVLYEARGVAT